MQTRLMKKINIIFFVGISLCIFAYGFSVGQFDVFPSQTISDVKDFLIDSKYKSINDFNYSIIDFESLISIENEDNLYEKRNNLINYIWKSNKIPNNSDILIEKNIVDSRYKNLKNLESISKITIEMDFEVNSISYLFKSKNSNGELVIYHQGHRGDFIHGKNIIEQLLNDGYSVLAFSMPLMGLNNQPIVNTENFGPILLNSHNKLQFLETNDFSPIKFFVEPIFVSLNYIDKQYDFTKYHFIGISGGGWTAIIYSAIDERISNTFSIAGTLPISLRTETKDFGDYEQTNPRLYSIVNYLEMYVISSYGENRKTTLIFNKFDPCCFDGTSSLLFLEPVQKTLKQLEKGDFDIIIDDTTDKHEISDNTFDQILKLMK